MENKSKYGYLKSDRNHIAIKYPDDIKKAQDFAEGYKLFLDKGKTERECTKLVKEMAIKNGYTEFDRTNKYKAGEKFYYVNRDKNIILVTIGKKGIEEGIRFDIAHIDSPRLDLKPEPLYESDEIALLKTHYYGGIRKYQWATIPLSMHGVVVLKNGEKKEICIGEDDGDMRFVISDLLPHLSAKQDARTLKDGIKGEELNIIIGNTPVEEKEESEPVKTMILKLLNEKYGMIEDDFIRAEIEMVPAAKACDIGLDRSLIGAYGQDDRVCSYAAVMAAFTVTDPTYTTLTLLTDKEEIGSEGNTGMASKMMDHFLEDLCDIYGVKMRDMCRNSMCISADVNSAFDPTFPDVFEKQNSTLLSHGPGLFKYTGARGKSGSNDASAETMADIISMMDRDNVAWQTGELGKVDEGGGGTIALFVADRDINTVDLGTPVLSMHSPFEVTSKLDLYHTYKAFCAFNK